MQLIRILEIFGEPIAVGGQESYVLTQISHMHRDGLLVDCLTPYTCESERQRATIENWGGKVIELGLPFHPGLSREGIRHPLRAFFKEHPYNVVHVHSGSTSVLAISASEAKKAKIDKIIVHSHVAAGNINFKQRAIRRICAPGISKADYLCACSSEAAISKYTKSALRKVKILHNGIDVETFSRAYSFRKVIRQEANIDNDTFVVGHVGRLSPEKNQQRLLKIFASLTESIPNANLWFVGDGPDRKKLEDIALELGISNKVHFWGIRFDIPSILAGMDVFIFPSILEGLPISLLEAQAAGLPCIVSSGVSPEAKISDKWTRYIPLEESDREWSNTAINFKGLRNFNSEQLFSDSDFNVKNSAAQLESLYRQ